MPGPRYAGGDKLYLPVENIELVSRYGSEDAEAQLDKLGGVAWQSRKARAKQRLRDMAEELLRIAAQRATRTPKPSRRRKACGTSSARASRTKKPKISSPRSTTWSAISPPAGRWIA